jgi:hypothetical protein
MLQENFIGQFYYSLADLDRSNFDASVLRRKKGAVSIFAWRHSVESFEFNDEKKLKNYKQVCEDIFQQEKIGSVHQLGYLK